MCCLCFDSKVPTWDEVKQLFAGTNKLKQILDEYDASRTTPTIKEKSKEYEGRPEFTVEFISGSWSIMGMGFGSLLDFLKLFKSNQK